VRASDYNFDLTRGHRRRHTEFGPDSQAFADRIGDIRFGLRLRPPLAHATWNRRALGDVDAVLVLKEDDSEFHAARHSNEPGIIALTPRKGPSAVREHRRRFRSCQPILAGLST
jgi:hypothetical protein